MTTPRHHEIARYYEASLAEHGDTHLGVAWPKAEDVPVRHDVMLDLVARDPARPEGSVRLLDLGCGSSHLLEHIQATGLGGVEYAGADISEPFVALSRRKFPDTEYWCLDLLSDDATPLGRFDYVVMNGVFTVRAGLSFEEMFDFLTRMLPRAFALADRGIAFNVMSKHVDWERDDLFHVPFDTLAAWLTANLGRRYVFRADYGLYEYTTYVYR